LLAMGKRREKNSLFELGLSFCAAPSQFKRDLSIGWR
jgi:hypothetical protein